MSITMKGEEHFPNDSHACVLCFLLVLLFQKKKKKNSLSAPLIFPTPRAREAREDGKKRVPEEWRFHF